MESVVIHDSVTDDYRDAVGPLTIGGGGLPDPSGEPDGQWLRTASGAAVWVAATAADIPFVPAGTISATDVQAAIEEVASEASGGVPTSRTLTAGAALTGGGTLAADRTFDVAVDGSTIEVASDALRVKADGITANEIAAGAVGASELASTAVTPGTYGDATHVAQVTVDADGRITGASGVAITGGGSGYIGYILLADYKTAATEGGTFTSGSYAARVIAEIMDTNGDCSVSSNQITLAAGTYECRIDCPAFKVDQHKARLRNVTAGTTILVGTNGYSPSTTASGQFESQLLLTWSNIIGRFTIAASQTLEIQHRCTTTRATNGLGLAINLGEVEVYTVAEFRRVS